MDRLVFVVLGGLIEVCSGVSANRGGYQTFTDEIPFKINWPGSEFTLVTIIGALYKDDDFVIMTTAEKEKYKCLLPSLSNGDKRGDYTGPSPSALLEPLFKQSSCSYRIESYWTYEVCHGKHVRQYHEEKETGQKINVQEYFLGNMAGTDDTTEAEKMSELKSESGKLSTLTCPRPFQEEAESPVREEAFSSTHKPLVVGGQTQVTVGSTHISHLTDEQLIREFLSGSYCLHGGVGWWKYEFCYGRHVHQYHEDKEQGKSIVVVGSWSLEEHLDWAQRNVARSYQLKDNGQQKVKLVSHFYGHGDLCDLTGKPRQVIVKLKCKESESPHAVTVYMLEPQTCQYILGVESPVICKILDTADEQGLLSISS
ncbi:endoplasmic reticulum lectin 1 [Osmerus eperlanus]|uniref:endoplasmic reticulum lectin 1 n=1 Tax=Osmerus eperlanus TaxID=29151 RepID=UPI002E155CA8